MIIGQVYEHKTMSAKAYPVHSNRASELGHPCSRYLFYLRTAWEEKALPDARLQMIFDIGNDVETRVLRDLADAGLQVVEQQKSFHDREHNISGHIDAKVILDGKAYAIEIKSMSPFVFEKINSVADMQRSPYLYMRKYPAQMTLYLLLDGKEETGFFILKNKSTGAMKEIPISLDYELGEILLKRAEAVNAAIEVGIEPDRMAYDDSVCGDCAFRHLCNPSRPETAGVDVVSDDELASKLDRLAELKPAVREYEEIDEEIKKALEGKQIIIGNWFCGGKWVERKSYEVPADMKAQFLKIGKFWKREVRLLEAAR